MILPETARLLEHVAQRWPHAQIPVKSGDVWQQDLTEIPAEAAHAAVRSWALAGHQFPPTSGWIVAQVERAAQLPAPSAEDAQHDLARLIARCAPHNARTPHDTAVTVRRLAEHGVHEAVLRWVQAVGVAAIRTMPDPAMHALDPNRLADRRDRQRHYERTVIEDWRQDPRPGLALERAERVAELQARGRRQLGDGAPVIELDAGDVEELPATGEQVSVFIEQGRRALAAARTTTEQRAAARRAALEREDAAIVAAERELAAHAARRRETTEATR